MSKRAGETSKKAKPQRVVLSAIVGKCLNVVCYRGFAAASVLSSVSRPDIYLQYTNPEGTQRDLSIEKARRAYAYMAIRKNKAKSDLRFFTEVVLNVRNSDAVQIKVLKNGLAKITIDMSKLNIGEKPDISRVEGNHRLAYAEGSGLFDAIEVPISFCLMVGVPNLMEAKLFRDINSNQRPMNTSHLDNLELQLHGLGSGEAQLHTRIADDLSKDPKSPFLDLVYRGGRKQLGTQFAVSLRTLGNLTRLFLLRSDLVNELTYDQQYNIIRSYWQGVSDVFPEEWNDTKSSYLMMKSAGLSALTMYGARLFEDAVLLSMPNYVYKKLTPLEKNVNWKHDGPLQGLNGLGGAGIIYRKFLAPFLDEPLLGRIEPV